MIGGRRYWAVDPLCVSAPCRSRLPSASRVPPLPAARGPPARSAPDCQRADARATAPTVVLAAR
jgi:hypothetical protein